MNYRDLNYGNEIRFFMRKFHGGFEFVRITEILIIDNQIKVSVIAFILFKCQGPLIIPLIIFLSSFEKVNVNKEFSHEN